MIASPAWEERKAELSAQMLNAGFWSSPGRFATLARLALIDRVQAATGTAHALKTRLDKGNERAGKSSRELVSRLALQLYVVDEGLRDVHDGAPIEVALMVEPAFDKPGDMKATLAWCQQVLNMYRAWSRKRNMQLTDMPTFGPGGAGALRLLLISGFGAHRILAPERGLHLLELADDKAPARATARVRVAAAPLGDPSASKLRAALKEALFDAGQPNGIVRRYRDDAAPLVRDIAGGWRSGRLDAVLAGDFDLIAATRAP
jgi:ATP-dependent Clp protease ATP-binding subunit ClpC